MGSICLNGALVYVLSGTQTMTFIQIFFKMSHQSCSKYVQDRCINQICIIILCTHLDVLGALLAYQTDG